MTDQRIGTVTDALGDPIDVSASRRYGLVNITILDQFAATATACLDAAALDQLRGHLDTAVLELRKVHR